MQEEAPFRAKKLFEKSLGGGLVSADMHDWKIASIQKIGLEISRRYPGIEKSFEDASEGTGKVNFERFKKFVDKHIALQGFSMTDVLL